MKNSETLRTLQQNIAEILLKHPEWADLPLITSSDDEGNSYHKVWNSPTPAQVHDIKEHYLELVGFEGDKVIDIQDVNCICIN